MGKISVSLIVLVICIVQISNACKGKPKPPPRCSYRTCSASYAGNFHPPPGENKCVQQRRKVHHNYKSHTRTGTGCRNVACHQRDIVRDWCKCNIYTTVNLTWSDWHVEPNTENKVCKKRVMDVEIKRTVKEMGGKACPTPAFPKPEIQRTCE